MSHKSIAQWQELATTWSRQGQGNVCFPACSWQAAPAGQSQPLTPDLRMFYSQTQPCSFGSRHLHGLVTKSFCIIQASGSPAVCACSQATARRGKKLAASWKGDGSSVPLEARSLSVLWSCTTSYMCPLQQGAVENHRVPEAGGTSRAVLVSAGVELIFLRVPCMMLCSGIVIKKC